MRFVERFVRFFEAEDEDLGAKKCSCQDGEHVCF